MAERTSRFKRIYGLMKYLPAPVSHFCMELQPDGDFIANNVGGDGRVVMVSFQ